MSPSSPPLRLRAWVFVAMLVATITLALGGTTASAHVLPTSSVQLVVGSSSIEADVAIPASDLEAASGIDLGDESAASVAAQAMAIQAYLVAHVHPTSAGRAWTVVPGRIAVAGVGDSRTTGLYRQVEAHLTLNPPAVADLRSFDLGYTAVVDRVATHTVIVTVASDWSGGHTEAYELGTIARNTVTNTVMPLQVELGSGSDVAGFVSMVRLGVQHIAEGTDHQLFLLTLLLPAPLLAGGRRWQGSVSARQAFRRITTITLSFTLGHSLTLALGALGLPVPQASIEVLIAASILVAAVHALRPLFPGREALVAGCFGLVHGLAFSETLRELDLSGRRLVLSLLGFNLGIELMQLAVVALVLPPLVLLARSRRFSIVRNLGAGIAFVAALGWVAARLGWSNPVADLADSLAWAFVPAVLVLWGLALIVVCRRGPARALRLTADPQPGVSTHTTRIATIDLDERTAAMGRGSNAIGAGVPR